MHGILQCIPCGTDIAAHKVVRLRALIVAQDLLELVLAELGQFLDAAHVGHDMAIVVARHTRDRPQHLDGPGILDLWLQGVWVIRVALEDRSHLVRLVVVELQVGQDLDRLMR